MKKKHWIILIIVLAGLGVAAWLIFSKKKETAVEWRTGKVERGDVRVVVTATGTLNADTTVQVGTQVSGIISKIFVDFNSVVRKGQVVAVLDTTYLAAAVEDAASSLYRMQVQVDLTKRNYDRIKQLFDEKVVAQSDYDQAYSDYHTALANQRSGRSALERAKINLQYATIVAPVSGVVISRNVDRGQTVAASFNTPTLFTIANDLTKMQVQASIDEADIGKIKVGQEVAFTVDAYTDQMFSGTVRQIRLQPVTLQNVVNYTVIIDVPNPDLRLMPGMTANITVKIQEALNVIKIPASATRFMPPQDYLDKILPTLPDSVQKMIEKIKKFREKRQGQSAFGSGMAFGGGQGNASQQASTSEKKTSQSPAENRTGTVQQSDRQGGFQRRSERRNGSGGRPGGRGGFSGRPGEHGRPGGQDRQGVQTVQKEQAPQTFQPGQMTQNGQGGQGQWRGRSGMALVWIKENNRLIPVRVKTGLSDGSYTEVEGNIKPDADVVTGVVNTSNNAQAQSQQQNPFAPQMPRPGGQGGGRGGR